ncbi:MAG TPA: xylose isomerase, partial [Planctomycetaceae bacterium]|nr:xylose isomerase [Planctomycetaceae bacterium]
MQRRDFLKNSMVAGSAAILAGTAAQAAGVDQPKSFQLKYGPHFGMFKNAAGNDPIDQLKFAADQGFTAWEDNGMKKKPKELQQQIADTMEKLNMQMGVFVAHGSIGKTTFTRKDKDVWDSVLKDIKDSVEVAKRVNAKWMTVVPGNLDEGPR